MIQEERERENLLSERQPCTWHAPHTHMETNTHLLKDPHTHTHTRRVPAQGDILWDNGNQFFKCAIGSRQKILQNS